MCVKISKTGFSLIEVMVAIIAFSILILAVGSILVFSWRGWRDSSEAVAMRRDAMISMRIIEKEIRNSNIDEITGDSNGIYFSVGTTRTNTFNYPASDIASPNVVALVSWGNPVIGSNYVDIAFSLETARGAHTKDYSMTVYPRNIP